MFSINQDAVGIVTERILPFAEQLRCQVSHLENGATVVDMGVEAPGGWRAGELFVLATIGGLGRVGFGSFDVNGVTVPSVDVHIDQPQTACLSSQFSGWRMWESDQCDGIVPIGSGPARALARNDIFSQVWPYTDRHHATVFGAQTTRLPSAGFVDEVAEACGVEPADVYVLAARTGSLSGSIQVCSRTVEASIWRIHRKGFDITKVISGMGTCPLPPVTRDEFTAMHRVNTALLYGVSVRFIVDCDDDEITEVIDLLPFNASRRFGERFADLFEEGERDFYKVDKDVHTVAAYEFWNQATGNVFRSGEIREDMLAEAFFAAGTH
ncbi:MAG TPA: methenyltetrahydromethanopterin cyclohydrolase [Acidimicrobiales bacterium]|nr:methenyltetrahydromethanopterin cyclohydrolase [Acidimicrobiales bacterium]